MVITKLEYDELLNYKYTTFTIDSTVYECNLYELPIDAAKQWLSKYSLKVKTTKGNNSKYNQIKRWVELATAYKQLIYFYPNYCSKSPYLPRYINESKVLDSANEDEVKAKTLAYWKTRSDLSPRELYLQEILDISRACHALGIKSDYLEFRVLDIEQYCGYNSTQCEKFYLMFKYMKSASNNTWEYSTVEWCLIKSVIKLWQSWLLAYGCDRPKLIYLIQKYLGINTLHPVIDNWLWGLSYSAEIDIYTEFYKDYSYSKPISIDNTELDQCFKVLGIDKNSGYSTAKKAYRELIKTVHPDLNQDYDASEITKDITIAWTKVKEYYNNDEFKSHA